MRFRLAESGVNINNFLYLNKVFKICHFARLWPDLVALNMERVVKYLYK